MRTLREQLTEAYRSLIPDPSIEAERTRQARERLKKMERPVTEREPVPVRQSIEQAWYSADSWGY